MAYHAPQVSRVQAGGRPMGVRMRVGCAACLITAGGCAVAPPLDNPALVRTEPVENPILVSPGVPTPSAYREVFEKTIEVLDDYFELLPPNPYEGKILTKPRIAPGYE